MHVCTTVYVCTYVNMYVCVCVSMYVCVFGLDVCMFVEMYACSVFITVNVCLRV